jgi:D-tyrosyl-tRNA(Tyr) deacylase
MIAVVERVCSAAVTVDGQMTGRIGPGLLVLLGVEKGDGAGDLDYIVRKVSGLRVFTNDDKMTDSVMDTGGGILVVSQFTLSGDVRHGRRPDFSAAADPDTARQMYAQCIAAFRELGIPTESGVFGAHMTVERIGDGPVTILLNSRKLF